MKVIFCLALLLVPALSMLDEEVEEEQFMIEPQVHQSAFDGQNSLYSAGSWGSENQQHHRSVRKPTTCRHPETLHDSELDCTVYPSKIVCNHTCVFGHTFSDGIRRQMKCVFAEDSWTPVPEFEKCQPFVDCGLTLGPGGKYHCRKNYMDRGAACEVSCAHYEDKESVPPAVYLCDIEGRWTPKLPFCARPGSGLSLVPAPRGPKTL